MEDLFLERETLSDWTAADFDEHIRFAITVEVLLEAA
jgi:hypothetical protein